MRALIIFFSIFFAVLVLALAACDSRPVHPLDPDDDGGSDAPSDGAASDG